MTTQFQTIIQFIVDTFWGLVQTCHDNFLLEFSLYTFVFAVIALSFSVLWKHK